MNFIDMTSPPIAEHIARLNDKNEEVRRANVDSLIKIGIPAVRALVEALTVTDSSVRWRAAYILGKIGDVSVVPALVELLKDERPNIRLCAVAALRKFGIPAIPVLIETLADTDITVRSDAALGLVRIGDSAIPALLDTMRSPDAQARTFAIYAMGRIGNVSTLPIIIEALQDEDDRFYAVASLENMGDSKTLPRKILADSRCLAKQRIDILERLRSVHYNENSLKNKRTLRYGFPTTLDLCQAVLKEEDGAAHTGAQEVLDLLLLLRGSQPDPGKQGSELVRPARGREAETEPETLLRAGQGSVREEEPIPPQPTFWQRLLRNGMDALPDTVAGLRRGRTVEPELSVLTFLVRLPDLAAHHIQARQPTAAIGPGVDADGKPQVERQAVFLAGVAADHLFSRLVRRLFVNEPPMQPIQGLLSEGHIRLDAGMDEEVRPRFPIVDTLLRDECPASRGNGLQATVGEFRGLSPLRRRSRSMSSPSRAHSIICSWLPRNATTRASWHRAMTRSSTPLLFEPRST